MSGLDADEDATVAVILGASKFPKALELTSSDAFYKSASQMRRYLASSEGLSLPTENILDLFDSEDPCSRIDEKISDFLKRSGERLAGTGKALQSVIVYYVGHGLFSREGSEYYLGIRDSRSDSDHSNYAIRALASTLKSRARTARRFLILDSCFSAAAYQVFQSAPIQAATQQILGEFPRKGTALLCASGPREPAKAPQGLPYTMFSGALFDVLKIGQPTGEQRLSLMSVAGLVEARIRELYPDDGVRPQVLSPDQGEGDISRVPFFPNAALQERQRLYASLSQLRQELQVLRDAGAESLAKQGVAHDRLSRIEERVLKLEESRDEEQVKPEMVVETSISSQRHIYLGLHQDQWERLPPDIKGLLLRYREGRQMGLVWVGCCLIAAIVASLAFVFPLISGFKLVCMIPSMFMGMLSAVSMLESSKESASYLREEWWSGLEAVLRASHTHLVQILPGVKIPQSMAAISLLISLLVTLLGSLLFISAK